MDKRGQEGTNRNLPSSRKWVCLSVFSFFQDFFSCCVSQNVFRRSYPPQGPKDGKFFGLEVETFVGTSRELKVSSPVGCQNRNKDCRVSVIKVHLPLVRVLDRPRDVHLSQYQPRPRSPAQWPGSPGRVTVPILIILRILLFISFSIQYAIRESSGKPHLILY